MTIATEDMTMPNAQAAVLAETEDTHAAAAVVEAFLEASMVPDPQTAARYIADELRSPSRVAASIVIRARPRRSTPSATSG